MLMYDVIIISDIHLGIKHSKTEELLEFLDTHKCKKLILNGDIIDGWALNRGSKWKKRHTKVVNKLIQISKNTEVVWIRGNHDEFLEEFLGFEIGNIKIVNDYVLTLKYWITIDTYKTKRYYVFHGDDIDIFMYKYKWLSKIGSVCYDFALWLNTQYNYWRKRRNLTYISISKALKSAVKTATNYVNDFENTAAILAKQHACQGVICGHIHQDANKEISGVHYLNSGDWVESMTAILIDKDSNIILYRKHNAYNPSPSS